MSKIPEISIYKEEVKNLKKIIELQNLRIKKWEEWALRISETLTIFFPESDLKYNIK